MPIGELWDRICAAAGCTLPPKHAAERPGDIRESLADIRKAEKSLRFAPAVPFEDGIAATYRWFKQR
jgi:UDP-N-acetylglucosamine 4-epimerase